MLDDVNCTLRRATDYKKFHIEDPIFAMNEINVVTIFDKPIAIQNMIDENEKHKKEMGKTRNRFDVNLKV